SQQWVLGAGVAGPVRQLPHSTDPALRTERYLLGDEPLDPSSADRHVADLERAELRRLLERAAELLPELSATVARRTRGDQGRRSAGQGGLRRPDQLHLAVPRADL